MIARLQFGYVGRYANARSSKSTFTLLKGNENLPSSVRLTTPASDSAWASVCTPLTSRPTRRDSSRTPIGSAPMSACTIAQRVGVKMRAIDSTESKVCLAYLADLPAFARAAASDCSITSNTIVFMDHLLNGVGTVTTKHTVVNRTTNCLTGERAGCTLRIEEPRNSELGGTAPVRSCGFFVPVFLKWRGGRRPYNTRKGKSARRPSSVSSLPATSRVAPRNAPVWFSQPRLGVSHV